MQAAGWAPAWPPPLSPPPRLIQALTHTPAPIAHPLSHAGAAGRELNQFTFTDTATNVRGNGED